MLTMAALFLPAFSLPCTEERLAGWRRIRDRSREILPSFSGRTPYALFREDAGSDGTNELHEEAGSECVYGSITLQFMGILCQELASGRFPRHLQGCHPVFGACPAAALPHLQLSMLLMLASRALHLESA
eukprot:TRINITY_DN5927_c0_g1_i1.p1 TRINITY_DN5927_c0_g1~~TRINITY_DN5927_c0_g1_i1.p1  ORF type:complete len:130 (-),score=19.94 TRINITY_DN5927_c0_g1_i1:19-408(-)